MKRSYLVLAAGLGFFTLKVSAGVAGITNVTDMANSATGPLALYNGGNDLAVAFTTGANGSTVISAQLELGGLSEVTTVGAQPRTPVGYDAYLFSNSGDAPGTQVLSLNALGSSGDVTFTPGSGNAVLAADTTYWLVLAVAESGYEGSWQYTTSLSASSPDGWTIATGHDTGKTSWTQGSSTETPLFSIETTPEPGTLALAGLGAAALGRFRRRG